MSGTTEFSPGPVTEKVSLVLENTCLACDLLMRLPDETADRLKANPAWDAQVGDMVGGGQWVPGRQLQHIAESGQSGAGPH